MLKLRLLLALLFVICFTLATCLQRGYSARAEAQGQSGNVLVLLLGDGRAMFARQFVAKADAYFHRGKYPSIFDQAPAEEENHMTAAAGQGGHDHHDGDHDEHQEGEDSGRDWIARFGRHFYPTAHSHLTGGAEREMLPWLRLSVELDPHQVQTYAVTAYFLRGLGKVDEAKDFLRGGLRDNPNNPELLYQLGLCFKEKNDLTRANTLWRAALLNWRKTEQPKESPDLLLLRNILDSLILSAESDGRLVQAIDYLEQLKAVAPQPESVQKRIDQLKAQTPGASPR